MMKLGLGNSKEDTHLHTNLVLKEISFLQVVRYLDKDPGPKIMWLSSILFFVFKKKKVSYDFDPILFNFWDLHLCKSESQRFIFKLLF